MAASLRLTSPLNRAGVPIIAVDDPAPRARPIDADVDRRAGVTIVTRPVDRELYAAQLGVACVRCAGVLIIAAGRLHPKARPFDADVDRRAGVPVITRGVIGHR